MNTPENQPISQAAKDAGTKLKDMIQHNREGYDYCLLPGVVQRAIDAETVRITADWQARKEEAESFLKAIGVLEGQRVSLREKLSETQAALESKNSLLIGTEGERDDAMDEVAALQAQLDEARRDLGDLQGGHELTVQELHAVGRERDEAKCQIVALRRDLNILGSHGDDYPEAWRFAAGSPQEALRFRMDYARQAAARTAKEYEGLVVVSKAEWETLKGQLEIAEADRTELAALQEIHLKNIHSAQDACSEVNRIRDRLVDERDKAEEFGSHLYYLITGRSPEWSNLFGYDEATEDVDDAQRTLRESLKKAESDLAAQSAKLSEAEKDTQAMEALLRQYGWRSDESLQMFLHRLASTLIRVSQAAEKGVEDGLLGGAVRWRIALKGIQDFADAAIAKGGSA